MATLSFNDFIVGPNVVDIKKYYPSSRKELKITLDTDITSWTVEADYQCLVIDTVAFDRSGEPNFTNSQVIGYFPKTEITGGDAPVISDAINGEITFYIPADMYTGGLLPGSRTLAVVAVVGLTYTDTNGNRDTIRFPRLISYEPDVALSDPTAELDYTAIA
jgi:hypothetical protein